MWFSFFAYSYLCKIIGLHINVCTEQQIGSTICGLWMNLFVYKSQVFHVHFGNYVLCLLCFPQSQQDNQRTKDMHFEQKSMHFLRLPKNTLVDNLLV